MSISSTDYEKLGQFYLGRGYDPETKKVQDDLILYDSKDLVTHGVVLGMTGSGKTGLCIALLEEAAMDNIPAIVIDPKGDISNLMLLFPELDGESFKDWVNPDDAAKKDITQNEHAAKTAEMWKTGLADWGQDPGRIKTLRDKVDINIFTPGSNAGIPVSILSSLDAPPREIMDDGELLGERIESTVSSLLSLVGVDADPIQSPEAVFLTKIFEDEWKNGKEFTLEKLADRIHRVRIRKIGNSPIDSFISKKDREKLAQKFVNLLASPSFATWLEGPPLDIAKMLHDPSPSGKPRISIFSIAHLSDSERMFFVSLLLNQMLGWMRTQNGTSSLRALLYMDEIYGFLPPTANPPSKRPMMTMLKQGRAFGLGCLLATQNPVDLDYKALSNIGTWFLGRLQTERDKMRVLDGLEGAAGSQNAKFDRKQMEVLLSGLDNRVFLMNNVHEDGPVLFHVRWAMSYLAGPLSRMQIGKLMKDKRKNFETVSAVIENAIGSQVPPMIYDVEFKFASSSKQAGVEIIYKPFLLRIGKVNFRSQKGGVDAVLAIAEMSSVKEGGINWTNPRRPPNLTELQDWEEDGSRFGKFPEVALELNFYDQQRKELKEILLGESLRISQKDKMMLKVDGDIEKLETRLTTDRKLLENRGGGRKGKLFQSTLDFLIGVATNLPGTFGVNCRQILGRRKSIGTVLTKAGELFNVNPDSDKLEEIKENIDGLDAKKKKAVEDIENKYRSEIKKLKQVDPGKVTKDDVFLLWLPFDHEGNELFECSEDNDEYRS